LVRGLRLYSKENQRLPHDECPMAIAIQEKRIVRGVEAIAERPDGTRVKFLPYPTPLLDGDGNLVGAVNMFIDVAEWKERRVVGQQACPTTDQLVGDSLYAMAIE
jgi:hypothetical protein